MKAKKNTLKLLIPTVLFVFGIGCIVSGSQRQREQSIAEEVISGQNAPSPVQDVPAGWKSLFDGKTLEGWEIVRYGGEGEPYVKNGVLILPRASAGIMTGLSWVGDSLPVNNYIVHYEALRSEGFDIFAGLSFPYNDTYASLIFGGWAGIVNGLSSIDGYDASENETTQLFSLENNIWYEVELRVTTDSIIAHVGSELVVNLATKGKELHLRPGLSDTGFTLWTYQSTGEIKDLRIKKIYR